MSPEHIKIIKDAIDQPENLSEWEYEFINELADKESFEELTDKQIRTLERIEAKLDY